MKCKKHTRSTVVKIAYLVALIVLSLALQACDESTDPSSPEDGQDQYTVTAGSSNYLREGPSYNWSQGYDANGLFYWARTSTGSPYNAVRWSVPFSTPGFYELSAYIPQVSNQVATVSYLLQIGGTQRSANVNQSATAGSWVVLGTFYFEADGNEYVELGNTFTQAGYGIAFDAMRWTAI